MVKEKDALIENVEIALDGKYYFPFRIEKVKDNGENEYIAKCINIKGICTEGKTLEEIREKIKDAMECALDSYKIKFDYKKTKLNHKQPNPKHPIDLKQIPMLSDTQYLKRHHSKLDFKGFWYEDDY